ncbi:MAG: hypothetical protein WD359_07580 [Dehalococcoidia bacterium]
MTNAVRRHPSASICDKPRPRAVINLCPSVATHPSSICANLRPSVENPHATHSIKPDNQVQLPIVPMRRQKMQTIKI